MLKKTPHRLALLCALPLVIASTLFALVARAEGLPHSTLLILALGLLATGAVLASLYRQVLASLEARDSAEAKLRAMNAELEESIRARTDDLSRANEELQQFAYVASHDLQEPLRTITSFSQLLTSRYSGKLDADADEFIGYIVSSSRRMTELINGLLALARLRKAGLPMEPVSLEDLLSEAQSGLHSLVNESRAHITAGDLPSLAVDRAQLTQVLQNLISNAIQYRGESAPVIHIDARREGSNWVFSVADNGRGFEQEYAERIFGLFQRLHHREVAEGTGMGLSICRKIVERHGGRMWAKSSLGQGSTFFFTLPTSLEISQPSPPARQKPRVSAAASSG